ncbi:ABC transporter permease [Nakamurella aerolata]|uniref:Transport permease protein n=1 Tax=Nakamurella aerolata TaxID=1656892 RepID=A0A849AIB6_9ACTN|nr:ABC transporter permease [Nakamurella aerolata]NNG36562.1 ABC transporter permease [Nakamurella aerolata]
MATELGPATAVTRSAGRQRGGAPLLRIIPLHLYAGRPQVVLERSLRTSKSIRWTLISGFFEPVFYLLAMGAGLGALVGSMDGPNGPVSYAAYIAPGLLATSAMNGAVFDSTMNVFFKLRYAKVYDAMLATSLGPMDVALGEIGWALLRGAIYATAFEVVMLAMGLIDSPWALLVVPAALLIAAGFAACGMAITTFCKTFQHLDWIMWLVMPMMLFSTTFYPLAIYPRAIQLLVEAFPLYHGIEIMRALSLGGVGWATLGHASYFLVMIVVGVLVAARRLTKLLLS